MKITHRIMSIALAFVMCTGLICTVNANENTGEMYFNFTKKSRAGAIDVGTINGKAPLYNRDRGWGFVSETTAMPPRKVNVNSIEVKKEGYKVVENSVAKFNITDKDGKLLDYTKATDYNYGGMVFRVNLPRGGYNIQVETARGKDDALVSVSATQTSRIENTKQWDAAGLVKNQHLAKWNGNVWSFDYCTGRSFIDIEVEPKSAGNPVVLKSIKITPIPVREQEDKPTVYLLGDSTLKSYLFEEAPMSGWGQVFDRLFDTSKINIVNYSMGGRSLKTMYQEGRLNDVLMTGHKGDFVLVQSGHNDEKNGKDKGVVSDPTARFGTGSTEEMYRNYLEYCYLSAIEVRGMIPILVTPMTRAETGVTKWHVYSDSFVSKDKHFTKVMRGTAKDNNVPLVDLNEDSVNYLNELGVQGTTAVVMSIEAGETPAKSNSGSYANGHPQLKIDGTHMKEALTKQYARFIVTDLAKLEKDYSYLKPLTDAHTSDVKDAIVTGNWDKVYPEVAKDCLTGDNAYYRNQIEKMLQLGVMSKDSDGNFNPQNIMTVKEYISALTKIYKIDESAFKNYTDGNLTREVMAAINLDAYNMKFKSKPKYMTDYNGNNITPDDPNYDPNLVGTEAQYYPLVGYNAIKDRMSISLKFADKVKDAYNLGLIRSEVGIERGKVQNGYYIEPQKEVTRAKAAKSLYFMYVLGSDIHTENDIIAE
ncbi:putative uncharacterized protein [Eubacterium sp. CAG:274]|nr:putative uncharacterized protein [Eubacterium sp. CAG:274]